MFKTRKTIGSLFATLLLATSAVHGDEVLFDNGVDRMQANIFMLSDLTPTSTGTQTITADDFVLAEDSIISTISWSGSHFADDDPFENFEIAVYGDSGGMPELFALFEVNVDVSREFIDTLPGDLSYYAYSSDISPLSLDGSTVYWLSIRNQTEGKDNRWYWGGELFLQNLDPVQRMRNGMPWEPFADPAIVDFRLEGQVVPEPSCLFVICSSGFVVGLVRRKRD